MQHTALAIGPRTKRRLGTGAISLGVIVALATALVLVLRPSNSGSALSTTPTHASAPTLVTQKIVYGMTKADVLRRIGQPTKAVGPCWQYDENKKIWDGEHFLNAERVCFLSGVYSYEYSEMDGKWFYPSTPLKIGS